LSSGRITGIVKSGLLLALLLAGCSQTDATSELGELAEAWEDRVENPHLVLIVVDTLRRDHLGCYGYTRDTSPNIDRLAGKSTLFENAFSQAPWTLPAVASLLTSRYPSELGIQGFNKQIPDTEVFLQEMLSARGYATHAVVSHDFVGQKWGFGQGFDSFESFAGGHRTVSSAEVTDAALRIVDQIQGVPTFLFVHYFDPHFLFLEHEGYRFADSPPDIESEWWQMPYRQLRAKARMGQLSVAQREYLLDLYDSEIAHTDHHVGRLLDRLENAGHLEDAIIIFTADHGEEFLDHGGLGHTSTVYNELINVPLIIKWPGTESPVRSSRYVAHVDLLPTLIDYLGIPGGSQVSGLHLGSRPSDAPIFSETRRYQKVSAVIQDGVKLVYDERDKSARYFDLAADSSELAAVAEVHNAEVFLAALRQYQQRAQAGLARLEQEAEIEITEEERQKLEALGYID
jgi:arylsulfatase A-like enzyme